MANSNLSSFLATDKVPESILGFRVVSRKEDYTEADLAFFAEHPEAAGYYDLEEEQPETGETGPLTRGDIGGGDSDDAYVDRVNAAVKDAIPFIKEREGGYRATAYRDHTGVWTIGYGQTTINGRPVREGDTISERDASSFVERRVRDNAVALHRQNGDWTRKLSQGALSALYDTAYNIGYAAFKDARGRSPGLNRRMREAKDGEHDNVFWSELLTYVNAGGKPSKGLANRRRAAIAKWRKS